MPKTVSGTKNDPNIKFSKLTIDEQEYSLAYSFNAIALAESASGTNLLKGLESLTDLSAMQLRGLLYAALTIAQPNISIEDAAHLIRLDTIGTVTLAIAEAYSLSLPEKKKDQVVEAAGQ